MSDPRNAIVMKIFALVCIGERAGSGLANIEKIWKEQSLPKPELTEHFNPDRTFMTLRLQNETVNDKENVGVNVGVKLTDTEKRIVKILEKNGDLTATDPSARIGVDPRTIERGLKKLKENNLIERVGSDKAGRWIVVMRVARSLSKKGIIKRIGPERGGSWKILF
ncbi:MAG: winged helix-turn-helix transcriptional regulator [Methanomassiliicoccaceae archaeon]|nr:winged helix-turn-helix transcriptional regulator [Methanomassiliicoccaceae archaeon]